MLNLNLSLFYFLNAGDHLHGLELQIAIFLAKYLICIIPLILFYYWLRDPDSRSMLVSAVTGLFLALLLSQIIQLLWFQPRPFMIGVGHTYLIHTADSSFPSDHMTIIWTIGLSFFLYPKYRIIGGLLLFIAVLVGWARVFLGLHFPFDLFGAIIVSSLAVAIVWPLRVWLSQNILPFLEKIYRKLFAKAITKKICLW